ncbi:LPS assembly lipoprotein LptE [Oleiharenicola lentus]|uniref:LPS assembly lipoprotein LptE n=1 Tax=Oleiharenicola lentus TaxID=2508720 RepID=UPI003F673866
MIPARPVSEKRAAARTMGLMGLCIALCFALSGCAGYQLGTGSTPQFSTLFIAPVKSEALIPQAQVLVTTQLREAIIRDSRVKLVDSPDSADATLHISLIGYDRAIAVARSDDTGLARRFDVSLRAQATLTDNRTKKDYFLQRPLLAKRGVFTDSGLVPSEYQAMPLLAEQLAKETVHAVLDTW